MKLQWSVFLISVLCGIISFFSIILFFQAGFGYDICIGIFSGAIFATITSYLSIVVERRDRIRKALLQIRHIKSLSNSLYDIDGKDAFLVMCEDIMIHYDIARDHFESIGEVPFPNRKKINNLFIKLSDYARVFLNAKSEIVRTPERYTFELAGAKLNSRTPLYELIQYWSPLVIKYSGKKMYEMYCDWDEPFRTQREYKTIREIAGEAS